MDYKLDAPIWNGREGNEKAGVNESLIEKDNTIEILYENKSGQRTFPHTYKISGMKILTYPVQELKGVRLRILPISELEVVK